jgi:hypothetical protein
MGLTDTGRAYEIVLGRGSGAGSTIRKDCSGRGLCQVKTLVRVEVKAGPMLRRQIGAPSHLSRERESLIINWSS